MGRMSRRAFLATTGVAGAGLLWGRRPGVTGTGGWRAIVLGSVQDGGLPQPGCYTSRCERARTEPRYVSSLCIASEQTGRAWLVDASPDLTRQMDLVPGEAFRRRASERRPFEGILLTHAHIGHYLGLAVLGREGLAIRRTPCYCSARMAAFLTDNGPWSLLVDEDRLDLRILEPGESLPLAPDLSVTPLAVPHRDEFSDTLAFVFRGRRSSLLYLPDIDRWDRWERRIEDVVAEVDVALVDATFYSADEVGGRVQSDVPHPLVTDTLDRLGPLAAGGHTVVLTHMNNSNPILDPDSRERLAVIEAGFGIARAGLSYPL